MTNPLPPLHNGDRVERSAMLDYVANVLFNGVQDQVGLAQMEGIRCVAYGIRIGRITGMQNGEWQMRND